MDRETRTFRQDARRHIGDRTGRAIRYSPDLRRRAVGIAMRRQRAGAAVATIARDLGLRPESLRLWLQEPRSQPRLRRVAITSAPESAAPTASLSVIVTPHGVRVDGLDLETLVPLLRALR